MTAMIRISNYSLNYSAQIARGQMSILDFLVLCRKLNIEGASLHARDLPNLSPDYLKTIRRAYLDHGLSMAVFTVSTNFGLPPAAHARELDKAREAIRAAMFPGRAAVSYRKVCEEAAQAGIPIGLQNHNHGALCRTGDEVLRFIQTVNHPNLVFLLDTGQWAGSRGASGPPPAELRDAKPLDSIRQTASLARYVRVKFYNPGPDGSEPWVEYDKVFEILRSVHYGGFIDIVYEPAKDKGEAGSTAIPRVVGFLRS
jgi:sugar phosphate isomerase/epimerase